MFLKLSFDSALQLHGQEEGANGRVAPTIRALNPEETANLSANSPAKSDLVDSATGIGVENAGKVVVSPLPKPKKPQNLWEELVSNPLNLLLLLVLCLYVYLMFLRPKTGSREQRAQLELLKNLKKNDRVVTTSGIHGIVSNINSEAGTITLRIDENSNSKLTIDRMSIRAVLS